MKVFIVITLLFSLYVLFNFRMINLESFKDNVKLQKQIYSQKAWEKQRKLAEKKTNKIIQSMPRGLDKRQKSVAQQVINQQRQLKNMKVKVLKQQKFDAAQRADITKPKTKIAGAGSFAVKTKKIPTSSKRPLSDLQERNKKLHRIIKLLLPHADCKQRCKIVYNSNKPNCNNGNCRCRVASSYQILGRCKGMVADA